MAAHERHLRVGPYILTDTLGVGTFGKVKLAVHSETHERFACKILDKNLVRKRVLSTQVKKEIEIMQRLKHRNTVSLIRVLSTSSKVFMIMELINGGELFEEIIRHKRLSEPYARFYFRQLIEGLQYCHEHGVYHRDLKPENLLLDENKTLKISDFGLSSLRVGGDSTMASVTGTLNLHTQCGTPNYVAPEIIKLDSEGYSGAKVDAWACGIILYVLVSGALPFDADDTEALFKRIMHCDITYPPYFSNDLIDLVSNLLNTVPGKRYSPADVKGHPWFNGPVEDSMNGEELDIALPPPVYTRSMLSLTNTLGQPDIIHGTASHTEDKVLATTNHTNGKTSLSSQHMQKRSSIRSAVARGSVSRTADSLDFCVFAKSMESKLAFEEASAPVGQYMAPPLPATILPATIWDSGNRDDTAALPNESSTSVNSDKICKLSANGYRNPVDRFRSRALSGSEGSSSRKSDDDIASELEDIQKPHAPPNGHTDVKVPGCRSGISNCRLVTMRRARSWSQLTEHGRSKAVVETGASFGVSETVLGDPAMRHRLKGEPWKHDAESWCSQTHLHHFASEEPWLESANSGKQNIRRNAGLTYLEPRVAQRGDCDRKFDSELGSSIAEVSHKEASNFPYLAFKSEHISSKISSSRSSALVRSHSHDGIMTVRPVRRRPRARPRRKVAVKCQASSSVGGSLGYNSSRTHYSRNCNRHTPDVYNELHNQMILNNSQPHDGHAGKERRRKVRFKEFSNKESRPKSSLRPGGDEIQYDLDTMLWCRMMGDFDMIPDNDEFEEHSTALNRLWANCLESEGVGRKHSIARNCRCSPWASAASVNGTLVAPMSRSGRWLSLDAPRLEVKQGSKQQDGVSKHKIKESIGRRTEIIESSRPNSSLSEAGLLNSNPPDKEWNRNDPRSILQRAVSSPTITSNGMKFASRHECSVHEGGSLSPSLGNISMRTERAVIPSQNRLNSKKASSTQDPKEYAETRITTDFTVNAHARKHVSKRSLPIPILPSNYANVMAEVICRGIAEEDNFGVGVRGLLTVMALGYWKSRESDPFLTKILKLGGSTDLLPCGETTEATGDSGEDEKSEREDSLMSVSAEIPVKVQCSEIDMAEKPEADVRWIGGNGGNQTPGGAAQPLPLESKVDPMIETNGGGVRRDRCAKVPERLPVSPSPVLHVASEGWGREESGELILQEKMSREFGRPEEEKNMTRVQDVELQSKESRKAGLRNEASGGGDMGRDGGRRAKTDVANDVGSGCDEGLAEDTGGKGGNEIEKVHAERDEDVVRNCLEHKDDDGAMSKSTTRRCMTKKSSQSSSTRIVDTKSVDPLSPFSMDIPGPQRMFALPKSRRKPRVEAFIPYAKSVRRVWERWPKAVYGGVHTQFYSVMKPEKCVKFLGKLLKEDGCGVKGSSRELKKRYKIEWETKIEEKMIGGTIMVSAYDQALTSVVFKKRAQTDSEPFVKFYSEVYEKYCERTRGSEQGL